MLKPAALITGLSAAENSRRLGNQITMCSSPKDPTAIVDERWEYLPWKKVPRDSDAAVLGSPEYTPGGWNVCTGKGARETRKAASDWLLNLSNRYTGVHCSRPRTFVDV